MVKPLIVDLEYPTLEVLPSRQDALVIAPAYSGLKGELTAILSYQYHYLYFYEEYRDIAETLAGISLAEMLHFRRLGKILKKLGTSPVLSSLPPYQFNFYNTSSVSISKTPQKMLLDDIGGEMEAIMSYKRMLENLSNENVGAFISRIILDEELHVKILKEQLEKINKKS